MSPDAGGAPVVVGPRTRLGRELVARARARGETVVVIARHDRDVAALEQEYGADPGVRIRLAGDADRDAAARIWICALGPVQSEDRVDPSAVEQELADLAGLVTPGAHVVLVSTVLVLAPTPDRRYYAGWKSLVEARVRTIATERHAHVSVLHPGRLVDRNAQKSLSDFVHTPYPKLAGLVEGCNSTGPLVRTVGLDARMWLLFRGARVASVALTGRPGRAD